MRKVLVTAAVALALCCLAPAPVALAAEGEGVGRRVNVHRLGFGANYWKTIDDIDEEFDNDGFSYIVSYQYAPVPFFKVEADVEFFPDLVDSADPVFAPELFVTVGRLIYAGAGIGVYYSDGDWADEPFYMLRAGLDFPIAPRLFLDINVNYRFNDWGSLAWSDLDTDTVRLGAAFRFTL